MLYLSDGVMPGRPAGRAAWLGKTASLPGAMRRDLRAFHLFPSTEHPSLRNLDRPNEVSI